MKHQHRALDRLSLPAVITYLDRICMATAWNPDRPGAAPEQIDRQRTRVRTELERAWL